MENATKGLLIAGSVLISLIIISLGIYMFSTVGNATKDFEDKMSDTEVQKFNEQFEKYIEKNDLTSHDVLTIQNLVENINKEYEFEYIKVTLPSGKYKITDNLMDTEEYVYSCTADYSNETSRIKSIVITGHEKNN